MSKHIVLFAPHVEHVGTKNTILHLAAEFDAKGHRVELVRVYNEWPDPPGDVSVVDLSTRPTTRVVDADLTPFKLQKAVLASVALPRLALYLRRERPDALVTGLLGVVGIAATDLAGVDTDVVTVVNGYPRKTGVRSFLWRTFYGRSDAVVAPVEGVRDQIDAIADLPPEKVVHIPDPVVTDEIYDRREEEPGHPWFDDDRPTLVAIGRQTYQKGFDTLLRALARVREQHGFDARLIVPGDTGSQTEALRELRADLGLEDVVDFPGFTDNPYAYMRAADLFVLSSRWEGGAHVLIEAIAAGASIVATDCPTGVGEILGDGEAGELVPVEDPGAMAEAIVRLLGDAELREKYANNGEERATRYHSDRIATQYLDLIE